MLSHRLIKSNTLTSSLKYSKRFSLTTSSKFKSATSAPSEFDENQAKIQFYNQRKEFHKNMAKSRKLDPKLLSISYLTAIGGGILSVATMKITGTLFPIVYLAPILYHVIQKSIKHYYHILIFLCIVPETLYIKVIHFNTKLGRYERSSSFF